MPDDTQDFLGKHDQQLRKRVQQEVHTQPQVVRKTEVTEVIEMTFKTFFENMVNGFARDFNKRFTLTR